MNWNHILVEGFCARTWEWRTAHSKYNYRVDLKRKNPFKTRKSDRVPNPKYDPNVKKPKRPKYCKKQICIDCIGCKHLAYSECEDEFIERFKKMTHDYFEEENKKEFG